MLRKPTPEQQEAMLKRAAESRAQERDDRDMFVDGEDKDDVIGRKYPYPKEDN
jgi:hypothetical protein